MTKFVPGHDARIITKEKTGNALDIEFQFSRDMDCDFITKDLLINSTKTEDSTAKIDTTSVICGNVTDTDSTEFVAQVPSKWSWRARRMGV